MASIYPLPDAAGLNATNFSEPFTIAATAATPNVVSLTKGTYRVPYQITIFANDYAGASGASSGIYVEIHRTNGVPSPSTLVGSFCIDSESVWVSPVKESDFVDTDLQLVFSDTRTYQVTVHYLYK